MVGQVPKPAAAADSCLVPVHLDSSEGVAVVLTRHTVKGGKGKKGKGLSYYTNDESLKKTQYYMDGDSEAEGQEKTSAMGHTVWMGKGAAAKGLVGEVDLKDFEDIALGYAPGTDRTQRIRGPVPKEKDSERLLHDNTYSPPKSITIGALVFGNEEILQIYRETVVEMAALTEERFAISRVQVNGVRREVKTGNLTIAGMEHYTSRPVTSDDEIAIDAQLHTHVLVANSTLCPDGVHRAIYSEKMMRVKGLNEIFMQKMALKLQAAGFALRVTENGFELADISDRDIEVFSKRTVQAKARAAAAGDELTPANIKHHAHAARQAKNIPLTLAELQEMWLAEAKAHGMTAPVKRSRPVKPLGKGSVNEELDLAIAHWSERSVSFSQENIEQFVFSHPQRFEVEALSDAIQHHPQLLRAKLGRFTTVEAVQREREIYYRWRSGEWKANPFDITRVLENDALSLEQQAVVINTLSSEDKHQIWQGFSGVGKTRTLRTLKDEWVAQGVVVSGYATTHAAAQVLSQELGIPAHTVARLTLATPEPDAHQLWIIDEASLVGAKAMQTILQKADLVDARILLVGDKGQNSSVEAGSPFSFLQRMGRTVHKLTQIKRQQDRSQRAAVQLFAEGKGKEGFSILESEGYIHEISNAEDRASEIASQYLELSTAERKQTLVVAGTNAERQSITEAIRAGLTDEGSLHSSVDAVQLVNKQFTTPQAQQIHNYQVGDFIKLHYEYKTTPLKKNVLYKVEGIKGDQLVLASLGGRSYRLDPSKYTRKTVYRAESINLAVGDRVRRTAAKKRKGQFSGQQLVITEMKGTALVAVDQKGHKHEVSLMEPLELDHDWVATTYRAQGKTIKRSIVSATVDPTSSQEPFYVGISRQEKFLTVYTEDLEELRDWVERSNVQENVIDLLQGDPNEPGLNGDDAGPDQYIGRAESTDAAANQRTGGTQAVDATTARRADREPSGDGAAAHSNAGENRRNLEDVESPNHDGLERDANHRQDGAEQVPGRTGGDTGRRERQQDGGGDRQDGQGHRAGEELNRSTESRSGPGDRFGGRRSEGDQYVARQIRPDEGDQQTQSNTQENIDSSRREPTIRLSQAIQAYRERRAIATSGLIEQITQLTDELESALSDSHPSMDRLAKQILDRRQNQAITEILPQISELLQAFNEDNQIALDRAKMEVVGDALDEWQGEQAVADALTQGDPKQVSEAITELQETERKATTARLAKAIQDRQQQQAITDAVEQVSQWVEQLDLDHDLAQPNQTEGMTRLAQAIQGHQQTQNAAQTISEMADMMGELLSEPETQTRTQRLGEAIKGRQQSNDIAQAMEQVTELVSSLDTSTTPAPNGMERLAQAIIKRQERLGLNQAMEQLTAFIEQLDSATESAQPHQGMERLARAILSRNQKVEIAEALADVSEVVEELSKDLQPGSNTQRLAEAISDRQQRNQLTEAVNQISELVEQLDQTLDHEQPSRVKGMKRLAQAIQSRQQRSAIAETLEQVSELVGELDKSTTPAPARMERLAQAILNRRNHRQIQEAMEQVSELVEVLDTPNETAKAKQGMERFAQAILERNQRKQFIEAVDLIAELVEEPTASPQSDESIASEQSQGNHRTKRLAQAILKRQEHQGAIDALEQVTELAEQLDSTQQLDQTPQSAGMSRLAQAIQNRRNQAGTIEGLANVAEVVQDLISTPGTLNSKQRLAEAIQGRWQRNDLAFAMEQVVDLVDAMETSTTPAPNRMERLAQAILNRRERLEVTEAIEQVIDLVEQLDTPLDETTAQQGKERLAKAIHGRQQHQEIQKVIAQISELVEQIGTNETINEQQQKGLKRLAEAISKRQTIVQLGPVLENIDALLQATDPQIQTQRLAQAIQARHDRQSLAASGLLEQITELADTLQQQKAQAPNEGMQRLADAIRKRRADQAIANHLEVIEALQQDIEQWAANMPELKQLADLVENIEAMATHESAPVEEVSNQLTQMGVKVTPKPQVVEVFWEPNYDGLEAPRRVDPDHWEEMKGSCIQLGLVAKNTVSIEESAVLERLLEDKFTELGAGQEVTSKMKNLLEGKRPNEQGKWIEHPELSYNRLAEGGWWGNAGVDPFTFEQSRWGCFKPDNPRVDLKKTKAKGTTQYRKYEHPLGEKRELYLLNIPDELAAQMLAKHGVTPREGENFWQTVIQKNLPIIITEGFKKTLSSLSQGHITVGLSGTNGSYHANDDQGRPLPKRVLDEKLQVFATKGRQITFAFDQDTKLSSILNVRRDSVRGIELLQTYGCECRVASWKPEQGKGLDDLIAQSGPRAYEIAIRRAVTPERVIKTHYRTLYNSLVKTTKNDVEVYIQAVKSGDLLDGDRVIRESTKARKFKPEKVTAYVATVKQAAIEQLRQGQKQSRGRSR